MIKKSILLAAFLLLAISTSFAAGLESFTGKVKNGYNYWFYTPEEADVEGGKPLVIFLHGRSLCGSDLNKVKRYGTIDALEKGREIDAFVLAPQNPGESWNPAKIMNVVEHVCAENNIDTDRIYVLGMSLGGYGAIDFAATYPDRIAAAIGMCGGATVKNLDGLASMPLWIIHGTADSAVPVSASDKVVQAVKNAQKDGVNRLQYDRVPGMNHSKPARVFYKQEVYDWLFSHSLKHEGRPIAPTVTVNDDFFKNAYSNMKSSKKKATPTASTAKKETKPTASAKDTKTGKKAAAKVEKTNVSASAKVSKSKAKSSAKVNKGEATVASRNSKQKKKRA